MANSNSTPRIKPRLLRDALGNFATGVTVVTYDNNGVPAGITVSSFTSVSLDPALVLVNLHKNSKAAERLDGKPFTINVLSNDQLPIAMQFAGGDQEDVTVDWDNFGIAPRFAQAHAYYTCRPWATYDGGDHIILVGEVVDYHSDTESDPLVFHQSRFKEIR
ncbi:MAG: flavin reductase family protein [Actinomycetaceae bacterium]|nr:flavin reductase family protein [Actinomycetaceae bacterium]